MTTEAVLDTKTKKSLKKPKKYKVVFVNDDQTPFEWVINILINVFKHSEQSAINLTSKIHNEGSAIVGVYHFEIAEQKASEAQLLSRSHRFPLQIKLEEE